MLGGLAGTAAIPALASPALAQNNSLKIGFVQPETGPLAEVASGNAFVLENLRQALAGGLQVDGGQTRNVEIVVRDSQSNSNRASEVAADLILGEEVDIMCAAIHPLTVTPVADQCELNGVPLISSITPWETQFYGRGATDDAPFSYQLHQFWGFGEITNTFIDIWNQLDTNKVVGGLWPNNPDGVGFAQGFTPILEERGFTVIDPGRYQDLTDDFSAIIRMFLENEVEIVTGVVLPPDWTTFWTQAAQQGLSVKAATTAAALAFPGTAEQLGPLAQNHSFDLFWHPSFPFESSVTGQSAADYAAAFEEQTGRQWIQPIGTVHSVFETAIDALKRSGGGDWEATREAMFATNLNTIQGPIVAGSGPVPNAVITPLTGAQWRQSDGPFDFEAVIVSNIAADGVDAGGTVQATA
ncbi:ABC transporter substrate-binding protein [Roseobacter sp. YSTF-M11]|uniref:ABC transporter substrate-binding protein n=1 Tax=Roseobacter insulae TaxID=2859783 RepID=A0A9X1FSY1_9RHOB|nr:ABC transporter substrate-binding protein [Roseobacter insulae]